MTGGGIGHEQVLKGDAGLLLDGACRIGPQPARALPESVAVLARDAGTQAQGVGGGNAVLVEQLEQCHGESMTQPKKKVNIS